MRHSLVLAEMGMMGACGVSRAPACPPALGKVVKRGKEVETVKRCYQRGGRSSEKLKEVFVAVAKCSKQVDKQYSNQKAKVD